MQERPAELGSGEVPGEEGGTRQRQLGDRLARHLGGPEQAKPLQIVA